MSTTLRRGLIPALTLILGTSAVSSVHAQDEAAGRVLFDDAMSLLNKGQLAEACPKFEESLRQTYNINAQYYLADCWERQGKTASAWTTFLSVSSKAREAGDEKRDRMARKRADVLEKRLVRLRVTVANAADDLEVRRDGSLVGRPMWGISVPVDPGTFEFTATASGYAPFTTTVVATVPGKIVDVAIPELARRAVSATTSISTVRTPPPEPVVKSHAASHNSTVSPHGRVAATRSSETLVKVPLDTTQASDGSSWRSAGWIAGGVGVGTVLAGVVVGLLARNSYSHAKSAFDGCTDAACENNYLGSERSAISHGTLATGLLIGGAALTAVAGVVLILGPGSNRPEAARPSVALRLSPVGVSFEGRL